MSLHEKSDDSVDFERLVALEMQMAKLSVTAKRIADESSYSRREIARRMGNSSTSNLQRLLGGMAYKASIDTLSRLALACDFEVRVSFVPVPSKERSAPVHLAPHGCGDRNVIDFAAYAQPYEQQERRGWYVGQPSRECHG